MVHVDVATRQGRALLSADVCARCWIDSWPLAPIATRFGVRGTPTYVLVSEDGTEREHLLGAITESQIAGAIERSFGVSCTS